MYKILSNPAWRWLGVFPEKVNHVSELTLAPSGELGSERAEPAPHGMIGTCEVQQPMCLLHCIYSNFSFNSWRRGHFSHTSFHISFQACSKQSPSAMAATEKNAHELEKASKLSNTPKGEQYERMISGML